MTGILIIFDGQKNFFEILKNWEFESDYKLKFFFFLVPISKNFFFSSSLTKGQSRLERLSLAGFQPAGMANVETYHDIGILYWNSALQKI
jgi:hypothetical protein